jgi:hypothetical protein
MLQLAGWFPGHLLNPSQTFWKRLNGPQQFMLEIFRNRKCKKEFKKKRVKGIEPSPKAWEAFVLPLNYTRAVKLG